MHKAFLLMGMALVMGLASCGSGSTSSQSTGMSSESLSSSSEASSSGRIDSFDVTNPSHVRNIGRYNIRDKTVLFAHSYSGFELQVESQANPFSITLSLNSTITGYTHQYANIYLDDVPVRKIELSSGELVETLDLEADSGFHFLRLNKLNEASFSSLELTGVSFSGCDPVYIAERSTPKIEFFGDSITCGYGNQAKKNTETFSMETEDASCAYGPVCSGILGYECSLVSFSGIAIAMSPFGSKTTMLDFYDTVDGSAKWDMDNNHVDYYVINLGTNDNTAYNLLSEAKKPEGKQAFVDNYLTLITALNKANPDAKIIICYNMMTSLNMDLVYGIDDVYKECEKTIPGIVSAERFEGDNGGADGHPGKAAHQVFGEELAEHIKAL